MGIFTTSIAVLSFSSASVYSVLRHYQLRRGPRKLDWSGLVFAYRGRTYETHAEKVEEFKRLLQEQKQKLDLLKKSNNNKEAKSSAKKSSSKKGEASLPKEAEELIAKTAEVTINNSLSTTTTASESESSSVPSTQFSDPSYSPYDFSLTLPKIVSPNSLAALEFAQINHASGIHVDCRVCKSGELVLFADEFCFPTLVPSVQLNLLKQNRKLKKEEKEEQRKAIWDEFKKKRVSDCQLWELKEMSFADEEQFRLEEEAALGVVKKKKNKKRSSSKKNNKMSNDNNTEKNDQQQKQQHEEEQLENWKKNRIITAEECIKFCFDNSLKLTMEVHVDSAVWGFKYRNIAVKQSRSKMIQSILQFYSSNPLPIEDRDFGASSLRRQRQIRKWFETETMVVSDDPWLLYKIRDINWQIPSGILVRHNWLGKRIYDRVYGYDVHLAQQHDNNNENQNGNKSESSSSKIEDTRPFYFRNLPFAVKIVEAAMWQINLRLTPWLTGCSAVSLPKQMFSLDEVEKWRKRDMLIYWRGFGSDPEQFTKEMRYEASGESLMDSPEQKQQDALVVQKMEENPYAKYEFRTPEHYKKKPLGGSCVVCDGGFIKFFPASK